MPIWESPAQDLVFFGVPNWQQYH